MYILGAFVWRILFLEEAFWKCSYAFGCSHSFLEALQSVVSFVIERLGHLICISLYPFFLWNCLPIPESEGPKQMGLFSTLQSFRLTGHMALVLAVELACVVRTLNLDKIYL